jgi:hypothetical protein
VKKQNPTTTVQVLYHSTTIKPFLATLVSLNNNQIPFLIWKKNLDETLGSDV